MKSNKIQSCCGSQAYIYTLDCPVVKRHKDLFNNRGFSILDHYEKVGILQAVKQGLTITVSYGQKKINVRCSGKNCNTLLNTLALIISDIENEGSDNNVLKKKNDENSENPK